MTTPRPSTVVYVATSLDGFIARRHGDLEWLGTAPEGEDYGWAEFIQGIDAMLMGSGTFTKVLSFGFWPYEGIPLTVLSRSLRSVPDQLRGKASISSLEPTAALRQLAEAGHQRVYVDGGKLIQSCLRADLIDELVISRVPTLLGDGIPLFGPLDGDLHWQHMATETYDSGMVKSHYRRAR